MIYTTRQVGANCNTLGDDCNSVTIAVRVYPTGQKAGRKRGRTAIYKDTLEKKQFGRGTKEITGKKSTKTTKPKSSALRKLALGKTDAKSNVKRQRQFPTIMK